jgi:HAMP domain-containing protein
MRISVKIITAMLLVTLSSIVLISSVFLVSGEKQIQDRVYAQFDSVLALKESNIITFFSNNEKRVLSLSSYEPLLSELEKFYVEPKNILNVREILKNELSEENGAFDGFLIMDLDGEIVVSTNPDEEGKIRADRLYFINGKERVYTQTFYYSTFLQGLAATTTAPIKNSDGQLIGVIAGRNSLAELSSLMTETVGFGESGETYIVNKFNYPVTDLKFENDSILKKVLYTDSVNECLLEKHQESHHMEYLNYQNTSVIGAHKWVPKYEFCLVAEMNKNEAFLPINNFKKEALFDCVVISIITAVIGYFVAFTLVKPINLLKDYADAIRNGQLDKKCEVNSKDEIEDVAITLDKMRLGIKDRNDLLNTILTTFKGKFGNIVTILLRKDIEELAKKNPRITSILPKQLKDSLQKGKAKV